MAVLTAVSDLEFEDHVNRKDQMPLKSRGPIPSYSERVHVVLKELGPGCGAMVLMLSA